MYYGSTSQRDLDCQEEEDSHSHPPGNRPLRDSHHHQQSSNPIVGGEEKKNFNNRENPASSRMYSSAPNSRQQSSVPSSSQYADQADEGPEGDDLEEQFRYPGILCGLNNIGNTCYFNSGLQCLMNVGPLISSLQFCGNVRKTHKESNSMLRRYGQGPMDFYQSFCFTMAEMSRSQDTCITPGNLLRQLANMNPQFEGFQQQDAPEMVFTALGSIEDATALHMRTRQVLEKLDLLDPVELCPRSPTLSNKNDAPDFSFPALATETVTKIKDTSSRRWAQVLQFMGKINAENAALEPEGKYIPPQLFRSAPHDIFKGYLLNETQCSNCNYVSRVVDSFSSLNLAMPTYKQRQAYHESLPKVTTVDAEGNIVKKKTNWNPFHHVFRCLVAMLRACGCVDDSGSDELGHLTLEECLAIHFESTKLQRSNKYNCEVCKSKVDAVHRSTILELPEVLLIQLKRFEFGNYWTTKKSEHVTFPLAWTQSTNPQAEAELQSVATTSNANTTAGSGPLLVVPSSPLMEPASSSEPVSQQALVNDEGSATTLSGSHLTVDALVAMSKKREALLKMYPGGVLDMTPFCASTSGLPLPVTTTYSLNSVINHHGSFSGGHYTAFVNKPGIGWILCNDHRVGRAPTKEVASSQGYFFVYQKQKLAQDSSEFTALRRKAMEYLAGERNLLAPASSSTTTGGGRETHSSVHYISRLWLHKLATYEEPGLILNEMCYCDEENGEAKRCFKHGDSVPLTTISEDNGARHFHCSCEWFYVPVSAEDWCSFQEMFGGGPAIKNDRYQAMAIKEKRWLQALIQSSSLSSRGPNTQSNVAIPPGGYAQPRLGSGKKVQ